MAVLPMPPPLSATIEKPVLVKHARLKNEPILPSECQHVYLGGVAIFRVRFLGTLVSCELAP